MKKGKGGEIGGEVEGGEGMRKEKWENVKREVERGEEGEK